MSKFTPRLEALDGRQVPGSLIVNALTAGLENLFVYVGDGPKLMLPGGVDPAMLNQQPAGAAPAPVTPLPLATWNVNVTPAALNSDGIGTSDIASTAGVADSGLWNVQVTFTIYQCTANQPGAITYSPTTGLPTNGTFEYTVNINGVAGPTGIDVNSLATDFAAGLTTAGFPSGASGAIVHVNGPSAVPVVIDGVTHTAHGIVKSVSIVCVKATDFNGNNLPGLGNYAPTVQQSP
jgi:hypothetical protein